MRKRSWKMFYMVIAILAGFWLWNASGSIPLQNHLCSSFIGLQQAISAPATKPATAGKSQQSASSAGQSQVKGQALPLMVQRLYLKTGHVRITIAGSGKGQLDLEDYPHILIKVAGSKTNGSGQWTLAQVDPGHVLLSLKGKIDFDTWLVLKKTDRLTATITFGTWKYTKQETLTPSSILTGAPAGQSASSQSAASPTPTSLPARASGAARPSVTPPTPVPLGGTISGVSMQTTIAAGSRPTAPGGLTFSVPGAGQTVIAGDTLYFILRFEPSIAEGDVTLTLRRAGSSTAQATVTYHYRPIEGEWMISSTFAIPARSIAAADDYFLHAVHAAGNTGVSPLFAVHLPGTEGLIRILKPAARDVYNPKMLMRVNYQLTRAAAGGLIRFEMYAQSTARPVLSWTSDYRAQPAGAPQPVFIKQIKLPADLPFSNNYFIQASHAEGSGRSGIFSICPLINHGGAEVVEDIAITDIFKDASGTIKVRARVTGARWPIWVQCLPYPYPHSPGATGIILHPGDNEFTIDSGEFNGAGGACSRNFSVRLDPNNRYTEANEANNNLEKTIFFLDRNGKISVRRLHSLDSAYLVPCYTSDDWARYECLDFVLTYCGTDSFNVSDLVHEVRQSGSIHELYVEKAFDQSVTYRVFVTDLCGFLGEERELSTVAPGQCVYIRVIFNALAHQMDSNVTLYLNEPAASWPGIRNPATLRIKFGNRSSSTGECVYR